MPRPFHEQFSVACMGARPPGTNRVPGWQLTVSRGDYRAAATRTSVDDRTVDAVSTSLSPETGAISESDVIPETAVGAVDLHEAARQLELAEHDVKVALSCIGLGNLERAHEHTITARTAADAAETMIRAALADGTAGRLWPGDS
jgi:hypothetical protein